MGRNDEDSSGRACQAVEFFNGPDYVGQMLDDMDSAYGVEGIIAEGIGEAIEVTQQIGAAGDIAVDADGAGIFIHAAADVENTHLTILVLLFGIPVTEKMGTGKNLRQREADPGHAWLRKVKPVAICFVHGSSPLRPVIGLESTMAISGNAGLVRGLGFTAAASLNIANMIGTGVFLKARVMSCNTGSPLAVLAVWALAAALVLAGALTYAELAAMLPRAGGEYVFLREAYGRRWAFLYGWTYVFISRGGSLAAQSVGAAIFFNIVTGGAIDGPAFFGLSQLNVAAIAAIVLTVALNCAAVSFTGVVATVLTAVKVTIVAAVGLATFLLTRGDWLHYTLSAQGGACEAVSASAQGGWSGFGAAMLGALWGYQGWANLAPLAGEIRDPGRNIPRALLTAVAVVASLYLLANASYFYALTPVEVASVPLSSSVATEALGRFLGPAVAAWMAMAMMISSLGALHSGMAATMRVPYAMAADGLFFSVFGRVATGSQVPVRAALLVGVWTLLLSLSGNYDKLTDYAIFALWLFYGLTAVALIVLRRRQPEMPRPYRTWGYPVVPILFVLVTVWLLLNTIFTAPLQALAGLGLMLLGLPFYHFWEKRASIR
jgi:APA family basic amino acid/polyamine antiporter